MQPLKARELDNIRLEALDGLFVVYVEDDTAARAATHLFLEEMGMLVESFASYEDLTSGVIDIDREPDVIISDYRLPNDKTARDVFNTIWEKWSPGIPAVLVTGELQTPRLQSDDIIDGKTIKFCTKPVAAGVLLRSIAEVCTPIEEQIAE